ncbi:MAG TPA: hypothetical protein VFX79_00395 [Candidatus Saccharimonadales bacterium]|nr:hypothetical protein [Candidatus Saccharimonadales bacterium]
MSLINPKSGTLFACFSPPVMLTTFAIEIGYLIYVIWRYKMNALARLSAALLFFLAMFQISEYFVCGGNHDANLWSRIGFVSITLLPPIGIHLIHTLAGKSWNNITGAAYGMAAVWIGVFAFFENAFAGHQCTGNYVIFQVKPGLGGLYFVYYYLWLAVGSWLAYQYAKTVKKKDQKSLYMLAVGYMILLVPTTTVNLLKPETQEGLASIMCGFAVLLATIVVFGILPKSGTKRIVK